MDNVHIIGLMSSNRVQSPNRRPDKKSQRTADKLAAVAFKLFERDGFDAVTMDQIAAEAGVVRATLYNHFRVKEALLDHYFRVEFETGIEALVAEVGKQLGLENQLNFLFDAFSNWAATKRAYLPYCLDYSLKLSTRQSDRPASSGLHQLFFALFSRALESGEIPTNSDIGALAQYLEHLYFAATLRWLVSKEPSPKHECRRMLGLFLNGVRASIDSSGARPR